MTPAGFHQAPWEHHALRALGCGILGIAGLAVLGWLLDVPQLTRWKMDAIPMAPATAALVALFGAALLLRLPAGTGGWNHRAAQVLAGLGMVASLMFLVLRLAGVLPRVETLFVSNGFVDGTLVGFVSPVTALCLVAANAVLLVLRPGHASKGAPHNLGRAAAALLVVTGLVMLGASLLGTPLLLGGGDIPVAIPTSTVVVLAGVSLLLLAGPLPTADRPRAPQASLPRTPTPRPFIWAFVAGCIAVAGFCFASYREIERELQDTTLQHMDAIAQLKESGLAHWRRERLGDAHLVYGNGAVAPMVEQLLRHGQDPQARHVLGQWFAGYTAYQEYDRMFVLDAYGAPRGSWPVEDEAPSAAIVQAAGTVLQTGRVMLLDFYRDERDGKSHLAVLVPIHDPRDTTRVSGVLGLRIDPSLFLYSFIEHWPGVETTAETLLVRRDGAHVLFLNRLRFDPDAALQLRLPLVQGSLAARAVQGERGTLEGVDYRGKRVLGVVRPIPESPWYLVARMDVAEFHARLWQHLLVVSAFAALVLVSLGIGLALAWRTQSGAFYRNRAGLVSTLEATSSQLGALLRNSATIIYNLHDVEGLLVPAHVSSNVERLLGYTEAETRDPAWWDQHIHPEDRAATTKNPATLATQDELTHQYRFLRRDGSMLWVQDTMRVTRREHGRPVEVTGSWNDITEYRTQEARARGRTQLYAALSQCNEAIVRCRSERDLFPLICRAAVEHGGMALAWVGLTQEDSGMIVPVASYGVGREYLEGIQVSSLADTPLGRGPTGTAVRENRPCWVTDFQHDPATQAWHERGKRFGWSASVGLPLTRGGRAVGALSLYALTADVFDQDGKRLLLEMATDISFALDSFDRDAMRLEAEVRLHESETRYRTLFAQSGVPMLLIEPETTRIADANQSAAAFYGWDIETLRTMRVTQINTLGEAIAPAAQQALRGERRFFEVQHRLASGQVRDVEVYTGPLVVNGATHLLSTVMDVTARRKAERAVKASLHEKEALLKEVHHRVKNNLQVITSLLRLEAGRSSQEEVKAALGEMQNRVLSMALLHETLYRSDNLAMVDLAAYLTRLANQIMRAFTVNAGVTLELKLDPIHLELDQALPCGLIVSELLTNSLKHAFPDGRHGVVHLEASVLEGGSQIRLVVRNNGVGLPQDWQQRKDKSLGLQLVSDLARQVHGTLDIQATPQTAFCLVFASRRSDPAADVPRTA